MAGLVTIYDGNNQFRVKLETDKTGMVFQSWFNEIQASSGAVIVVWDGMFGNKRRRDLYPAYKTRRLPLSEDITSSLALMKQVVTLSKAISFEIKGWEGDDVIATIARAMAAEKNKVIIHSTDGDFRQLTEDPNVECVGSKPKHPPRYVRLYKTLVGDNSDCIAGIPKYGEKSWAASDKEVLLRWAEDGFQGDWPDPNVSLSKPSRAFVDDHRDELRRMWEVVGFYRVPDKDLAAGVKIGSNRPDLAHRALAPFALEPRVYATA